MATADLLAPLPSAPQRDPVPRLWTADEFERMKRLGLFTGREVELTGGTILERTGGSPRPFVFTRREYYALSGNHFFRTPPHDQRVQLLGGVIVLESPMNPPHAVAVRLVTKAMERIFRDGYDVRAQLPLDLGLTSEPHPDVAVVTGSPRDYLVDHPTTAVLVVEVSESTIEADTHDKASLYATAGIADYWVVDLTTDRVLTFRNPASEAGSKFGQNYASVSAHGRDDRLTPLAAPAARIPAGELLP